MSTEDEMYEQGWSEALALAAEGIGKSLGTLSISEKGRAAMLAEVVRSIKASLERHVAWRSQGKHVRTCPTCGRSNR